jgi:Fe-S cluster assembly protein SufD
MQLFYAESRGLDPASARALLLEGFVMGLWDSAKDADAVCEAAREALRRVVSPSPLGEGGAQPQAGRVS